MAYCFLHDIDKEMLLYYYVGTGAHVSKRDRVDLVTTLPSRI